MIKAAQPTCANLHLDTSIKFSLARCALVCFLLACCGLLGAVQAAPRPDGDIGNANTAGGSGALISVTTGTDNTGEGYQSLFRLTTGGNNTAFGYQTLFSTTTASGNTATGSSALYYDTVGALNTANGALALIYNTTGNENTASGANTLVNNTTGNQNTATGASALYNSTTAFQNTAIGGQALWTNTTGNFNTALGFESLYLNTTGSYNIALGYYTGANLTTGSYNIDIGNPGVSGESGTIRIGTAGNQTATFLAGVTGVTVASGTAVVVDANGQLGTIVSSQRFKSDIKPMDKTSEAILALKPVTFRYKHELDPQGIAQFGLVAEEVEKVSPDLVARDAQGKVYTVRYEAVNAMLLNEFLKEHAKVEALETTVAELKSAVAREEANVTQQQREFATSSVQQQKAIEVLTSHLKEQALQIERVSAQLDLRKVEPRVVRNAR